MPACLVLLLALAPAPVDEAGALRTHAEEVGSFATLAQQVFGPLPAVASTPFFGLAALSGVALLTDTATLRETRWRWLAAIRDNRLVAEARHYSTLTRFLVLVLLALVGYLANSGKLQGLLGKAFRVLEDSSVMVGYTLLVLASLPSPEPGPAVAELGVGGGSRLLLPLATAVALAAMMAVRFAFDVLIWLNPIPFVDLLFETAKKLLSLGLLLLYAWSPGLATVVCLLLLVATALAAGWAHRVLEFYRRVLLNPLLCLALPSLRPQLVEREEALRRGLDPGRLAVSGVALQTRDLPRRTACLVVVPRQGPATLDVRGLRRRLSRPLLRPGERLQLGRALFWVELRVVDGSGRPLERIAFSRALEPQFEALRGPLDAEDVGGIGARGLIELAGEVAGRSLAAAEGRPRS